MSLSIDREFNTCDNLWTYMQLKFNKQILWGRDSFYVAVAAVVGSLLGLLQLFSAIDPMAYRIFKSSGIILLIIIPVLLSFKNNGIGGCIFYSVSYYTPVILFSITNNGAFLFTGWPSLLRLPSIAIFVLSLSIPTYVGGRILPQLYPRIENRCRQDNHTG